MHDFYTPSCHSPPFSALFSASLSSPPETFLNFIRFLFLRRFLPYALKCPSSIYQSPIVGYIFFSSTSSSDSCEWLNYTRLRGNYAKNIKIERDEKLFYCGIIIFLFHCSSYFIESKKVAFPTIVFCCS